VIAGYTASEDPFSIPRVCDGEFGIDFGCATVQLVFGVGDKEDIINTGCRHGE
jgi:hypothetical protein